jgi:hypothetical protein
MKTEHDSEPYLRCWLTHCVMLSTFCSISSTVLLCTSLMISSLLLPAAARLVSEWRADGFIES